MQLAVSEHAERLLAVLMALHSRSVSPLACLFPELLKRICQEVPCVCHIRSITERPKDLPSGFECRTDGESRVGYRVSNGACLVDGRLPKKQGAALGFAKHAFGFGTVMFINYNTEGSPRMPVHVHVALCSGEQEVRVLLNGDGLNQRILGLRIKVWTADFF